MYVGFLYTWDVNDSPNTLGIEITVSRNGKMFGPISNVKRKLGCKLLSLSRNGIWEIPFLKTHNMSSTYLI